MEISAWVAEQTSTAHGKRVGLNIIFPEDLGGPLRCGNYGSSNSLKFLGRLYKFMSMHPRNAVRRNTFLCGLYSKLSVEGDKQEAPLSLWHQTHCSRLHAQGRRTSECWQSWDRRMVPGTGRAWQPEPVGFGVVFHLKSHVKTSPGSLKGGSSVIGDLHIGGAGDPGCIETQIWRLIRLRRHSSADCTVTDNRSNGAVLNKLLSTRFPSLAVLMELASFMKSRG